MNVSQAQELLRIASDKLRPVVSLERWFSRVRSGHDDMKEEDRKLVFRSISKGFQLIQKALSEDGKNIPEGTLQILLHCAEISALADLNDTSHNCLRLFFDASPGENELYIRACYCRAMLGSMDCHLLKGEDLAHKVLAALDDIRNGMKAALQDKESFSNLVYEGSKRMWNTARMLNKDGTRELLHEHFQFVNDALQKIDHNDITWRIRILLQFTLCQGEANKPDLAGKTLDIANDLNNKKNTNEKPGILLHLRDQIFRSQVHFSGKKGKKVSSSGSNTIQNAVALVQSIRSGVIFDEKQIVKELLTMYKALVQSSSKSKPSTNKSKKSKSRPQSANKKPQNAATQNEENNTGQEKKIVIPEDILGALSLVGLECSQYYRGLKNQSATDLSSQTVADDQVSLDNEMYDAATDCAKKCATSLELKTRVYGEYTTSNVAVQALGHYRERLTQRMLDVRIKALRSLERALESARRVEINFGGADAIHDGCILLWNQCLPLLQSNLRHVTRKPLQLAAVALEDMDSNMTLLRTMIHLEITNCDIQDDVLTKASENAKKALKMDYVVDEEQQKLFLGMKQPLDRYLDPISERLDLKTNMYKVPETNEEEAYLVIEQAKESLDATLRKTLLERAMALLLTVEDHEKQEHIKRWQQEMLLKRHHQDQVQAEPNVKPATSETVHLQTEVPPRLKLSINVLRRRFHLWSDIIKTAWNDKYHIMTVTRQAVEHAQSLRPVDNDWDIVRDREIHINRALAHYILAETYILELQQDGLSLSERFQIQTSETEDSIQHDAATPTTFMYPEDMDMISRIQQSQVLILKNIEMGVTAGLQCQQDWIVINGCAYMWNCHFTLFKEDQKFLPFREILSSCFHALIDTDRMIKGRDNIVLSRITYAYVNSLIQTHVAKKMENSYPRPTVGNGYTDADVLYHKKLLEAVYEVPADSNAPLLKSGLEACEKVISLVLNVRPFLARELIYQRTTIQRMMSGKSHPSPLTIGTTNDEKTMIYCEILCQPHDRQTKCKYLRDGLEQCLKNCKNVQMHSVFAEHALTLGENGLVISIGELCDDLLPTNALDQSKEREDFVGEVTMKEWRWFAMISISCAKATRSFLQPSNQNQRTQNDICMRALELYERSMLFAKRSSDNQICINVVQNTIAVVAQLMRQSNSIRRGLIAPLQHILDQSSHVKPQTKRDRDLFEQLYSYLFISLKDCKMYERGIDMVKQALKQLPMSHHKTVWQFDIEFRSLAGMSCKQSINRIRAYDAETQAKVYITLGHYSSRLEEKQDAFNRAIQVLNDRPSKKVAYMIEYASWLYSNNFPIERAIELLVDSVQILQSMDHAENDEENDEDGISTLYGGSVSSSQRETSSTRSSKQTTHSHLSKTSSKRNRSLRNSSTKSKRSRRSTSRSHKSTRSTLRSTQKEMPWENEEREEGEVEGTLNIEQLNLLSSCFVLLCLMSTSSADIVDFALSAHFYYMRMIQCAVEYSRDAVAILSEMKKISSVASGSQASKEVQDQSDDFSKLVIQDIPNTIEDWIGFEFDPTLRQMWTKKPRDIGLHRNAMKAVLPEGHSYLDMLPLLMKRAMNTSTITAPETTLFLLHALCDKLCSQGFHVHCLPMHSIMRIVAEDVISDRDLTSLALLRMSLFYEQMSMPMLSSKYRNLAEPLEIASHVKRLLKEEHDLRKEQAMTSMKVERNPRDGIIRRATYGKQKAMDKIPLRSIWVQQASILIQLGDITPACELLGEAREDAISFEDQDTLSKCDLLQAKICNLQGNTKKALDLAASFRTRETDLSSYRENVRDTLCYLLESNDVKRAMEFAATAVHAIENILKERQNGMFLSDQSSKEQRNSTNANASSPNHQDMETLVSLALLEKDITELFLSCSGSSRNGTVDLGLVKKLAFSCTRRFEAVGLVNMDYIRMLLNCARLVLHKIDIFVADNNTFDNATTSRLMKRLKKANAILLRAKTELQIIFVDVIPSGSVIYNRYPISTLNSEALLLCGRTELLLHDVEKRQRRNSLGNGGNMINVNGQPLPTMENRSEEEFRVVEELLQVTSSSMEEKDNAEMVSILEKEPMSMTRVERALALFSDASNSTISPTIRNNVAYFISVTSLLQETTDESSDVIEQLMNSIREGIRQNDWPLISKAALDIAHSFGKLSNRLESTVMIQETSVDMTQELLEQQKNQHEEIVKMKVMEASFIALAQSARSSNDMLQLFRQTCEKSNFEACLLRLYSVLKDAHLINSLDTVLMERVQSSLHSLCEPWRALVSQSDLHRHMSSVQMFDGIPKIPENTVVLCIYHVPASTGHTSVTRHCLYGSVLVSDPHNDAVVDSNAPSKESKAKRPPSARSKTKKTTDEPIQMEDLRRKTFMSKIELDSLTTTDLQTLIDLSRRWKVDVRKELLRQPSPSQIEKYNETSRQSRDTSGDVASNVTKSERNFDEMMRLTRNIVCPLLEPLQDEIHFQMQSKDKRNLLICIDPQSSLSRIPTLDAVVMDALLRTHEKQPSVNSSGIADQNLDNSSKFSIRAVSRDFSLGFYLHRLDRQRAISEKSTPSGKKGSGRHASATSSNVVSTVPDWKSLRYIVDPEDQETSSLSAEFNRIIQSEANISASWKGIIGKEKDKHEYQSPGEVPDITDYQRLLSNQPADSWMMFHGYDHFFDLVIPEKISTIDLRCMKLAVVLDQAVRRRAFEEESQFDERIYDHIALSVILSLRGVPNVVVNQYATHDKYNTEFLRVLLGTKGSPGEIVANQVMKQIQRNKLDKTTPIEHETHKLFNTMHFGPV